MKLFLCCKSSSQAAAVIDSAEITRTRGLNLPDTLLDVARANSYHTSACDNDDRKTSGGAAGITTTEQERNIEEAFAKPNHLQESFLSYNIEVSTMFEEHMKQDDEEQEEDTTPSSKRRKDKCEEATERTRKNIALMVGSWGLNESITLNTTNSDETNNKVLVRRPSTVTFKQDEGEEPNKQKKRSSNELMYSLQKKTIVTKLRRASSSRDGSHFEASICTFYSEETEEQRESRRENYREAFDLSNSQLSETQSSKQLQNEIIDWNAKHDTLSKMRSMQKFFSTARLSVLSSSANCNTVIAKLLKRQLWLESFVALDPRRQIHSYFTEVARKGGPLDNPLIEAPISIIRGFRRAASFSVWRPTSNDAISLMMTNKATGKGLEVKGKSAKCGRLSGLIPFIQIYEDQHKNIGKLGLRKDGRIRVYFKSEELRAVAIKRLLATIHQMMQLPIYVPNMRDDSNDHMDFRWEVEDYGIHRLTESGYGIDISECVFYQSCVLDQDISRTGDLETGRASEPNFQAMNFDSTRSYSGIGPRTVVYQVDEEDPLKPQTFVIAYEENKTVAPVASDFDCFTVGTRGVVYDDPMATEQVELMKWMIESIDGLLEKPVSDRSWASHWFDVLDKKDDRKKIDMPRFGFGDPKSYKIMEGAVTRFAHNKNGAVRHGAECFNYKFPQEIDDKLLVIADYGEIDGTNRPFKYMTPTELQEFMLDKLGEGFVFPLNPKWIIADIGWKRVFDKMMASKDSSIQQSLETWYPKASGVRRLIDQVYEKHPNGFMNTSSLPKMEGTEALDLMQQQLRRRKIFKRALFAKNKKLNGGASLMTGKIHHQEQGYYAEKEGMVSSHTLSKKSRR